MRPVFLDYPSLDVFNDAIFFRQRSIRRARKPPKLSTPQESNSRQATGTTTGHPETLQHGKIALHPALDELPLYVRAGAIIPMQPVVQNT